MYFDRDEYDPYCKSRMSVYPKTGWHQLHPQQTWDRWTCQGKDLSGYILRKITEHPLTLIQAPNHPLSLCMQNVFCVLHLKHNLNVAQNDLSLLCACNLY